MADDHCLPAVATKQTAGMGKREEKIKRKVTYPTLHGIV